MIIQKNDLAKTEVDTQSLSSFMDSIDVFYQTVDLDDLIEEYDFRGEIDDRQGVEANEDDIIEIKCRDGENSRVRIGIILEITDDTVFIESEGTEYEADIDQEFLVISQLEAKRHVKSPDQYLAELNAYLDATMFASVDGIEFIQDKAV